MKEKVIVEIRSAAGGDDSKLLIKDQASIYRSYCAQECL